MACSNFMEGDARPCLGGPGAPIICDNKQYGIATWGSDCDFTLFPTVWTQISPHFNNIYGMMKQNRDAKISKPLDTTDLPLTTTDEDTIITKVRKITKITYKLEEKTCIFKFTTSDRAFKNHLTCWQNDGSSSHRHDTYDQLN